MCKWGTNVLCQFIVTYIDKIINRIPIGILFSFFNFISYSVLIVYFNSKKKINISKFIFKFKFTCISSIKDYLWSLNFYWLFRIRCTTLQWSKRNNGTILTDVQKESPKVRGYVWCLYTAESFQLHFSIVKKGFFFKIMLLSVLIFIF